MGRIVVLSDLHLGDPMSSLECEPPGEPDLRWFREALERAGIGRVDYLVLAGDILDFMVASFKRSYSVARGFFTALRELDIVDEIIYIPGNHDRDVWDSVQKEVNVFRRLRKGKNPEEFPYEQPGVIDNSAGGEGILNLPGVDYAKARKEDRQYGQLFLEGLFPEGEGLPIAVVYPNLYVVAPGGRWILVTHGHHFELAWGFITEAFGELLTRQEEDPPDGTLKWLEECNIPVNSLICTALGQGGPSTRLLRRIHAEVKGGGSTETTNVIRAFLKWLDEEMEPGFPLDTAQGMAAEIAENFVLKELRKHRTSRGSTTFLKDKQRLIEKFLEATRLTVNALNEKVIAENVDDYPDIVIFGHTHVPLDAGQPESVAMPRGSGGAKKIAFMNTGGCLRGETAGMICIDEEGACKSLRVTFPVERR